MKSLTRLRGFWWLAAGVLLLALAGVAALALRAPQAEVLVVNAAPLVRTLQFSARVAALSRVEIGSTLTARVARVLVDEGAAVRAGQPLLQLEPDELRAALAQAQASEAQARARLDGLRGSGRLAARAALGQAEATTRAAESELARVQQLVAQGFVSASRLDDARRAVDVARAQRDAARAQAEANDDSGTDITQARAQLAAAQATTGAARARLAQATLVAPAAARVLVRQVEPGQIVQPGKALLVLALDGPTQLVAQVDERFLDQLAVGQRASVVADAFPAQRMAARVLSLAPSVDAQRGAVEVKFALEGAPPPFLRDDMTLSVEVETARRERALVLPLAALRQAADGSATVLVLRDGRAATQPVGLGLRTLDAAEVLQGLAAGDQVLLGGGWREGQRLRAQVRDWRPGQRAAGAAGSADAGAALTNAMGR